MLNITNDILAMDEIIETVDGYRDYYLVHDNENSKVLDYREDLMYHCLAAKKIYEHLLDAYNDLMWEEVNK